MQKLKPKWLAIVGTPEVNDASIRHVGEPVAKPKKAEAGSEAAKPLPQSVLRSDTYFEDGDITYEAFLPNDEAKIHFRLGNDGTRAAYVGLNIRSHAYGILYRELNAPIERQIASNLAGSGTHPPLQTWLSARIHVRGSVVELFINSVRVALLGVTLPRAQLELVFLGLGDVQVRNVVVESTRPQVFVVMQFTDEYDQLFREVISPVCADFGYEVIRGDNMYTTGLIIQDIAKSIQDASLIIADITPNNVNVYYEVGYAHGISKPTILLSDRKRDKLPFDISGFRLLFYDNTIGGKSEVEGALRRHLEAIRA